MTKFLIIVLRKSNFNRDSIEPHLQFLKDLDSNHLIDMGGPFADSSGGAYVLNVKTIEEARAIAFQDPVYLSGSSTVDVYQWITA